MKGKKKLLAGIVFSIMMVMLVASTVLASGKAVSMNKKKATLTKGEVCVILLNNPSNTSVKWKSSRKGVAKIVYKDNTRVVVKGGKKGSAKITATAGGKKVSCKIKVKATSNKKPNKTLTLLMGTKYKFKMKKKGTWSVSDNKIAVFTARTGKKTSLVAKNPGITTFSVKLGGKTYSCRVTVVDRKGNYKANTPAGSTSPSGSSSSGSTGGNTDSGSSTVLPYDLYDAVEILWDDNNNALGLRPSSLSVTLVRNDRSTQNVTLTSSNGYKYSETRENTLENFNDKAISKVRMSTSELSKDGKKYLLHLKSATASTENTEMKHTLLVTVTVSEITPSSVIMAPTEVGY